ncbi:MAG TPA: CGNR zinc finger domain-containing protein [Jiangellaceae bacterium]
MGSSTTELEAENMPSPADSDLVTASLALLLPDEPVPVRLMNTIWADRHGVHDALTTTENLRRWLAAVAPEDEFAPDSTDLSRFRTLRDALRRLAALATDDTRPAAASATTDMDKAIADVNDAARQAHTWPQLEYQGGELQASEGGRATPTRRALSSIARQAIELLTGDDGPRLRACYGPGCVLYFVKDHPRREWCSNACGNRARAARHYHRHRKSATDRAR